MELEKPKAVDVDSVLANQHPKGTNVVRYDAGTFHSTMVLHTAAYYAQKWEKREITSLIFFGTKMPPNQERCRVNTSTYMQTNNVVPKA